MAVLVRRSVTRTLFSMAFPMLAGTFAMNAYHLADTWFVSRLGTLPLAAMGFTFPVVMLLTCVARGIGSGVTTLVSHAIGRYNHDDAARLVTHGTMLTVIVTAAMSIGGYFLIVPVSGFGPRKVLTGLRAGEIMVGDKMTGRRSVGSRPAG
jgi:Na+-driven multidrug efflux pump